MTDVPDSSLPIQFESIDTQSPVSESSLSSIAGLVNFLRKQLPIVGSTDFSMLTELQYQAQKGTTDWILADGRAVPGSQYAALVGPNVPDMRGVFPRGKNNGRSGGTGNPSGETPLGGYESDRFAIHSHAISWADDTGSTGTGLEIETDAGNPRTNDVITAGNTGGSETAPRSVTGNFFIRIN